MTRPDPAREMAAQIEPHIPALRRFAWALLRDAAEADDLVQDCLERAISRWHLHRPQGTTKAWLFTILYNRFIDTRRRAARRGHAEPLDAAEEVAAAGTPAEARLVWQDAMAALDTLPEEQRTVLLLVGVEEFSYEAVARLTGAPIGTVMSRLARGRARLHRLLEGDSAAARPLRRVK